MNVFRNYVEHAERPKERRWTRAAMPNSQHLAASATRRSRPYKRVHQEKGQPENHEVVQSAQRRREQLPTRPKNRKVRAEKKAREKNGRAAAMIRKARCCGAGKRMQKRKHPMRLENFQTRHVALRGRGTARKKPFQGNPPNKIG